MAETQKNLELYKEVVDSVDIIETIKKYIPLEAKGSYFEGNCPFSKECGPSFCVSATKKQYYCFGCHSRGNVIDFIAKIGNQNKATAARFLKNLNQMKSWGPTVE